MRFMSLRAVFLLGFVVAMPVLALPPVARRIDEVLYGSPPTDFGGPSGPAARPLTKNAAEASSVRQPEAVAGTSVGQRDRGIAPRSDASPANLQVQSPELLAANGAASMSPTPPFAPLEPPSPAAALSAQPAPVEGVDPEKLTVARLQQIRQRLEALGAEYFLVEARDSSRDYRCLCRMVVDERSRQTQAFEATRPDPLAAGEQVLRDVEAWRGRTTGISPSPVAGGR